MGDGLQLRGSSFHVENPTCRILSRGAIAHRYDT